MLIIVVTSGGGNCNVVSEPTVEKSDVPYSLYVCGKRNAPHGIPFLPRQQAAPTPGIF
jgi:hypothetical protein